MMLGREEATRRLACHALGRHVGSRRLGPTVVGAGAAHPDRRFGARGSFGRPLPAIPRPTVRPRDGVSGRVGHGLVGNLTRRSSTREAHRIDRGKVGGDAVPRVSLIRGDVEISRGRSHGE